jgi:NAD(P)-dependent dehydrogenase (short-subunit alcohol dehydrogenase family)
MPKKIAIVVAIIALIPTLLGFISRVEYKVHTSGGVLVTGASTGIGQTAVLHLAAQGFRVYAGVRKEKDKVQFENNSNVQAVILDVTKQDHIDRVHAEITADLKEHTLLFVGLINNAGISPASNPVELINVEHVRWAFDVNVFSVFSVTKKFTPLLRQSKGRVINVSSIAGLTSSFIQSAYCATKYSVEAFSDAFRQEMLSFGVSVSNVNPGMVHTPILGKIVNSINEADKGQEQKNALYGAIQKGYAKSVKQNSPGGKFTGWTTDVTDQAILSALTDKYPKTNYVVAGINDTPAWIFVLFANILPKRMVDNMMFTAFD